MPNVVSCHTHPTSASPDKYTCIQEDVATKKGTTVEAIHKHLAIIAPFT